VFVLLLLCLVAGCAASKGELKAYSGKCGDNVYWNLDPNDGTFSLSGEGEMYDYGNVRNIPWFDLQGLIRTLKVQNGVKSICQQAFSFCDNLTSVSLPRSISFLGPRVFYLCPLLESVTLPENLKVIPDYAFFSCESLTSVVFPKRVEVIGYAAFNDCPLPSLTIPETVKKICIGSFSYGAFETLVIPDSVEILDNFAFDRNKVLKSVTMGKNVRSIGDEAFRHCTSLVSFTFKGNYGPHCGEDVFTNTDLTVVHVPSTYANETFCGLPVMKM